MVCVWNHLCPSERQMQDAADVWRVKSGTLDQAYLQRWAATSNVQQSLDQLADGRINPNST